MTDSFWKQPICVLRLVKLSLSSQEKAQRCFACLMSVINSAALNSTWHFLIKSASVFSRLLKRSARGSLPVWLHQSETRLTLMLDAVDAVIGSRWIARSVSPLLHAVGVWLVCVSLRSVPVCLREWVNLGTPASGKSAGLKHRKSWRETSLWAEI